MGSNGSGVTRSGLNACRPDLQVGRNGRPHLDARVEARAYDGWLRAALDGILSVLLAPACAACEELLDSPTRGAVCPACWAAILPLTPPLCDTCGDPLSSWRTIGQPISRCVRCRRTEPRITCCRAIGEYDGALRDIVHALKYDGRRSLAAPLGTRMRERGAEVITGADVAVPVPLHPARRRERGFNQAADLAKHLGIPVVRALARVRPTAPQVTLPEGRRHGNVRGAFATTRPAASLSGRVVVLVDDVSTTGATLEACARALDAAAVREVRALTAARVVTRRR
jgi:ComF family protein